jgi:hypothetical protein
MLKNTEPIQPTTKFMAIKMISNYSKKLGLPGFSSHQFSVSVETELATTADIPAETERLYHLLQTNVDKQIETVGFVPPYDYGMEPASETGATTAAPNGSANGSASASALAAVIAAAIASAGNQANPNPAPNGNGANGGNNGQNGTNWQRGPAWKCSDKQRDLILKLVEEHQLDKAGVEALAIERFGKGVRLLNKIEASGLIDELLDTHGGNTQGNTKRRNGSAYNGANGRRTAA